MRCWTIDMLIVTSVLRKRVFVYFIESYIVVLQLLINTIAADIYRKASNNFVIMYLYSLFLTSSYFLFNNI